MAVRKMEVQRVIESGYIPDDMVLQQWLEQALVDYGDDAEVLVRIVGTQEMCALNAQYRHRQGTTNILSFPFDAPDAVAGLFLLGDLVVCAAVLEREAEAQQKTLNDHWAHIIIHGILHLLGYDHVNEGDALEMEAKEILILRQLNIENPYQEQAVND